MGGESLLRCVMEPLWIVAGTLIFALGLGLGILLESSRKASGGWSRPMEASGSSDLRAEVDRLRLDWEDAQDKLMHLYDRVRKRARVADDSEPSRSSQNPVVTLPDDGKARLRAIARERGLLR